jgi:hypothetical protein
MVEAATRNLPLDADVIAPDGCEVRILVQTPRGSMAHFTLGPRQVSRAIAHCTVEEVWYFLSGNGRMWRQLGEREEIVDVAGCVALDPAQDALPAAQRRRRAARSGRRHHAALARRR